MTVSRELIPPSDDLPWPLHRLPVEVDPATLPERFTCPFCYRPHPLCVAASASVQAYIASRAEWRDELAAGKMFGVLIVRDRGGAVGFLAAFSGNLAASNHHAYFVPPVYDMLQPDGFFLREDRAISELNDAVAALEQDARLLEARRELHRLEQESQRELSEAHAAEVRAHEERERLRAQTTDAAELAALTHASQHEHALLHQLKRQWAERLAEVPHVVDVRGAGLMVGCDLDEAAGDAHDVVARALEAGFVINATGDHTLRFLPPLICERTDVDDLVACLAEVLG